MSKIPALIFCIFAYCVALLCSAAVSYVLVDNRRTTDQIKLESICIRQRDLLRSELHNLLRKAETISSLMVSSKGDLEAIESIAPTLYREPSILAIALAPKNKINYVYPVSVFEGGLIGRRLSETRLGGPLTAADQRLGKTAIVGPIHMRGGILALLFRMPIYMQHDDGSSYFWGYVAILAHFDMVLSSADFSVLRKLGMTYEIWKKRSSGLEPEIVGMDGAIGTPHGPSMSLPISVSGTEWILHLSIVKAWYEYIETWLYIGLNVLLSIVFVALLLENRRQLRLRRELEQIAYNDPLTGALSRRGFIEAVENKINKSHTQFTLFYLDMNKFKEINDTYGHKAGDHVLKLLVNAVRTHAPANHTLGRIGGDEFVLILDEVTDPSHWTEHINAILDSLSNVELCKDCYGAVRFSLGWAVYPEDGKKLDVLLSKADARMYKHKMESRLNTKMLQKDGSVAS